MAERTRSRSGGDPQAVVEAAGPEVEVAIVVEDEAWMAVCGLDTAITSTARRAYLRGRVANDGASNATSGAIATLVVALLSDAGVRTLNQQFRSQDKPTNVLSFPALGGPAAGGKMAGGDTRPLGDLALAYETIAREARDDGIEIIDHVRHLIVHGVLHLLGHDHGADVEADRMESLETSILAELGVADPYAR